MWKHKEGCTWVYFLKNKYHALTVFKQLKSVVEMQFNKNNKSHALSGLSLALN